MYRKTAQKKTRQNEQRAKYAKYEKHETGYHHKSKTGKHSEKWKLALNQSDLLRKRKGNKVRRKKTTKLPKNELFWT